MNNKRTLLFMAYTIVYVIVVGCVTISIENMRLRYNVDAFIIILTVVGIHALIVWWRSR